ncbi:MAG: murein hydrolase activator EnvC [Lautropia sp.]
MAWSEAEVAMANGAIACRMREQRGKSARQDRRAASAGRATAAATGCTRWAVLAMLAVLGACASSAPAPVVNRTVGPPAALPAPVVPPAAEPPAPVATLPAQEPPVAEVNPIRPNSLGSIDSTGAGAGDTARFKTGPKGLKRPYGELASVDPRATGTVPVPVNRPPQPVSTLGGSTQVPAPVTVPAPAVVASTKPAGGSGVLEGIAFSWPLEGRLLQGFDDTSGKGVALEAKTGTPVSASADGKVIFSGAGPKGYGNLVIVKHSAELLSVYANNRSLSVKEGESVKRGQKIAEVGAQKGEAPQLHFEIRQQGKPIDPLGVLPARR